MKLIYLGTLASCEILLFKKIFKYQLALTRVLKSRWKILHKSIIMKSQTISSLKIFTKSLVMAFIFLLLKTVFHVYFI